MIRVRGRHRAAWLCWLALAAGCAEPICADRISDTGTDATSDMGHDASSRDATASSDAPIDPCLEGQGPITLGRIVLVNSASGVVACTTGATLAHVRVVRAADGLVTDLDVPCGATELGVFAPGHYQLAMEHDGMAMGRALVSPESCSGTLANDPWCQPLDVLVDGCGRHAVTAALYCNPATPACSDLLWPWE